MEDKKFQETVSESEVQVAPEFVPEHGDKEEWPKTDEEVKTEDRSEYNCSYCAGEGITFPKQHPGGLICTACHGTGKV